MRKQGCFIAVVCSAMAAGFLLGMRVSDRKADKKKDENQQLAEKNRTQFFMMTQWLKVRQMGRSISAYLLERGYNRVAIYGMSYTGERVLFEFRNSGIEVAYGIDQRAGGVASEIDILLPDDDLPCVDAVIVSETFFFEEIKEKLSEKLSCPVISLEEVVYES